jgi:hypothetical protein
MFEFEQDLWAHESTQEILADADHHNVAFAGGADRAFTWIGGGSAHLHLVLTAMQT